LAPQRIPYSWCGSVINPCRPCVFLAVRFPAANAWFSALPVTLLCDRQCTCRRSLRDRLPHAVARCSSLLASSRILTIRSACVPSARVVSDDPEWPDSSRALARCFLLSTAAGQLPAYRLGALTCCSGMAPPRRFRNIRAPLSPGRCLDAHVVPTSNAKV
jgi:hypothetical protein